MIAEQTDRCLEVYDKDPKRVQEDANGERRISEGGYQNRQLEELLQNAVDAARRGGSRVEVMLNRRTLYVANDGEPFSEDGLLSIMASDLSTKDDTKIGRFGIGFKSLLAVSDSPKVFSRSASFGFDRAWSEDMLRREGYKSDRYPVMRLAQMLDPASQSTGDTELRHLMEWASTVVVVPLKVSSERLSRRLNSFPAEFVLFSPHVRRAELRNFAQDPMTRVISAEPSADGLTRLRVGSGESLWKVAHTTHHPTQEARIDGAYSADREDVAVDYAVRVPPGKNNGTFWAYFPTGDETTLSGIVNAPWKLSEDRLRVLPGRFNAEILTTVVPRLVGVALQAFDGRARPGDVLDVLPARGRETRSWADKSLSGYDESALFDHLRTVPSLPDGDGTLRVPSSLKWPGELDARWLHAWSAISRAPRSAWVHPELGGNSERALKIRRLLDITGADGAGNASVAEWLEALVRDRSVQASADAIGLAARISEELGRVADEGMRVRVQSGLAAARIVRFEEGTFGAARHGHVFVRVEGEARSDVSFVDPALAALPGVRADLAALGVVVMDRTGELHALLARARQPEAVRQPETVWRKIWQVLRDIPEQTSLTILRGELGRELETTVRIRTAAGSWSTVSRAFLSGVVVPADGSRDRDHLIDPVFHKQDERLLRELGAVDAPTWRYDAPHEPWVDTYKEAMREQYGKAEHDKKVDLTKVSVEGTPPAWPLEPLITMSEAARVAVTSHILARGVPRPWRIQYANNKKNARAPEMWFLRKYGLLSTTFGNLPPHRVLRAGEAVDPKVLPAYETSDSIADALALKSEVVYSEKDWLSFKATADRWVGPDDDGRRTEFYSWLVGHTVPETLVVRVGARRQAVKLENIGVTSDHAVYDSMLEAQVPALFTESEEDYARFTAEDLWALRPGGELLQEEIVAEPAGEAEYLIDVFPPVKVRLAAIAPDALDVRIQPCRRLVKMIATPDGQRAHAIKFRRDGDTVLVTGAQPRERLVEAAEALNLGLREQDIAKIFDEMERRAANKRRHEVRVAEDDDARLLLAVGADAIRRIVPAQALEALETAQGSLSDRDVAALARAVHGVGILKQLRGALEDSGLEPPKEWSGRRLTRLWVASLGFPADWAGFPSADRPAVETIDGPVDLGDLHPYQVEVTRRITALLRGIGPDRGMVSLPTGAGKTRVTVQALVDGVHAGDIPTDVPLVWIAQTDELCEQAAETWTEVWRACGPRMPMRLGRLWSGREVDEEPGSFQLVIATIDKLGAIVKRDDAAYAWLQSPSVVVIDEAHTSVATSYTTVLDWLGRSGRGRRQEARRPLIGLTATPFRGNSKYETERLVGRYDNNRLDRGAFRNDDNSYGELQSMGVLATVRHELIDGAEVVLSASELARMVEFGGGRLPTGVETRLGEQLDRTRRIADHIASQPPDWTMLAFTPSVDNARVLAALLSHRGIAAVSVSADTDSAARRYYVEEFKAGRIRVITNYNILTQGFDAPRVRAVYVARPTFSPNVYQQMIGRGLRGPKNGGLDEVLIVNVNDNFKNYGEQLAFTEFEYLWNPQ